MMNLLMKFPLVYVIFITTFVVAIWSNSAMAQCEVAQLTSPKGEKMDGFAGVVIDGDLATVTDSFAHSFLGAVYVYRRGPDGPGDWKFEAELLSPKPDPKEGFGACGISGDVIVVGADGASAPEFHQGRAYVYRHDGSGHWKHEATLTASDGDFGDDFGWSVAIDANIILIGARNDENDGVPLSGSAYIFRYDPQAKQWLEEAKLTNPNGKQLDLFGFAVSLHRNVALVTAGTDEPAIDAGSVFVFRHKLDPESDLGTWHLETQLIASDAHSSDFFGWSISSSKDVAVIGARWDDDNGTQSGSAYVFRYDRDKRSWIEEAKLLPSDGQQFASFGSAVSCNEKASMVLIGAPLDNAIGIESGSAYLFSESAKKWDETAKLTASNSEAGDFFGASVALGSDIGFIGTNRQSGTQTVYIFDIDPPVADLDCDGIVDLEDLMILLGEWGPCADCADCNADLDGNCIVSTSDLLILFANWRLHP